MWWRGKKIKTAQSARSVPQAETQLEEIKQLKRKLDDLTKRNDAENHQKENAAASLRSEIFRKLSILQVLRSCPSQSSKTKRRSWRDILRLNKFGASPEREEGKCGDQVQVEINDYLQQIINAYTRGRGRTVLNETFPFYWLLPPEMREQILMRVESPGEKLNVIAALPQDSTFLRKDLSRLLCEVETEKEVLLKTSELTKEQSLEIDKDNINYLKEWMSLDSEVEMLQTLKMVDCSCRPKWRNISRHRNRNPISVTVALEIHDPTLPTSDKFPNLEKQLNLLKIMRHCGVSIWKCCVDITYFSADESEKSKVKGLQVYKKMFGYLCDYLRQTPELRYLEFCNTSAFGSCYEHENEKTLALQLQAVKNIPLPELAHLRYLDLRYVHGTPRFIGQRIMEKYASQLNLLIGPIVNNWMVTAPKLDALVDLRYTFLAYPLPFRTSLFNLLSSSPIKYVHLEFNTPWPVFPWSASTKMYTTINFTQLMCSLNCFGGTLEKLRLVFNRFVMLIANEKQEWIGSLRLPKLKLFDITGCPGEWSFLLQFPCLETLALSNKSWECPLENYFPPGGIPKLSWNLEELSESSLWELLPYLDCVLLEQWQAKGTIDLFSKVGSYRISRTLMEKVRRLTAHKRMELL